jgi:hypothetical protein
MKVSDRCLPPAVPIDLANVIRQEVHSALKAVTTTQSKFIVNDTLWLEIRPSGNATPAVLNEAYFISKTFQRRLVQLHQGWSLEANLDGQTIDAYKEFTARFEGYYLDEAGLRQIVEQFWSHPKYFRRLVQDNWPHADPIELDQMVWWLSSMYYRRNIHDVTIFPPALTKSFIPTGSKKVRVAVEFETGNTASAYRAFVKLNSLYATRLIDIGIFVATSKQHAHRIWPVSNRNVHYDELTNRGYRRSVFFPIWEILWEPDGYSPQAEYLKADGTTYLPTATGDTFLRAGVPRPIYVVNGRRLIAV